LTGLAQNKRRWQKQKLGLPSLGPSALVFLTACDAHCMGSVPGAAPRSAETNGTFFAFFLFFFFFF